MKSGTQILCELSHDTHYLKELSSEESIALKKVLIDVYKDISSLCETHNLTYMMAGGTCLGAVRHKGFIPWDDDLDIMMPRKDYDALLKLLISGELGPKYDFTFPNAEKDSNTVYLKIFRIDSKNLEIDNVNTPFPKGIFVDVFPLDAVPKSKVIQRIKGLVADVIQYISIGRLYVQYPSPMLKEYMMLDPILKRRYYLKRLLGVVFGFASHAKWVYWFDRFVSCSKENHEWGIPAGRKHYCGEIFDKDVYIPVTKGAFEGIDVNLPHDVEAYLTNLYDNYKELPPIEKRERHFVCEFELPKD